MKTTYGAETVDLPQKKGFKNTTLNKKSAVLTSAVLMLVVLKSAVLKSAVLKSAVLKSAPSFQIRFYKIPTLRSLL